MDRFAAIETFVQAAETRSFTEAGRRLGVSSSAVGRSISRLEQELEVRLFHRSTRAITLTAEGHLFLDHCYRISAEFELAREQLSHAAGKPSGRLRVGLPHLGIHLMPDLIAFQQRYPSIELELDFSDRLVNVIEEGFDAVMRIGEIDDSRLTMRRLDGYRHRLVASPQYLARRGQPMHPAELAAHACLRYRYPTSGKLAPWPLKVPTHEAVLDIPETSIANAIDPLMRMAEAGLGIALLPDFIIKDQVGAGRLTVVLDQYVEDQRNFCMLWPASRQSPPKLKVFVEFMANRFGPAGALANTLAGPAGAAA
ncbi:transcriptional regulator, LysR family [Pseudoxanthomonas sp. GM95]|uniref:LysR family transcriptional regulator n=1 Tax=Pseudoxanthomonas sp. GM95 TaxID=1881043 RepID=UPI0008C5623B|nr:LysR family transcriptional regulator [Pseudoxanthomonas sp. GM95]SEM54650.1 transcriptional regulator, LysR family [Pseudoxanthomonas sp. GM95]